MKSFCRMHPAGHISAARNKWCLLVLNTMKLFVQRSKLEQTQTCSFSQGRRQEFTTPATVSFLTPGVSFCPASFTLSLILSSGLVLWDKIFIMSSDLNGARRCLSMLRQPDTGNFSAGLAVHMPVGTARILSLVVQDQRLAEAHYLREV